MSYWCSEDASTGTVPTVDQNAGLPPIPADQAPKRPEWVQKVMEDLDEVRTRLSEISAELYNTKPYQGTKGWESRVERDKNLEAERRALNEKENGLMRQLRDAEGLLMTTETNPALDTKVEEGYLTTRQRGT